MSERITMAQVAARAGVHPTTVSLALRNHPSIPVPTRDRTRGLAAEMGYRPDPALSALAVYRHRKMPRRDVPALAYLTHWDSEWGWRSADLQARFHAGAMAKAAEIGYKLEHFWLGEPGLSHQRMNDILFARGINGIIVAAHMLRHDQPLRFDWAKFTGVKIGYLPQDPLLNRVASDYRAIVQLAVRQVLARGYRRPGMVLPRWWDAATGRAWSAGLLAEQQELAADDRVPVFFLGEAKVGETVAPHDAVAPSPEFADWLTHHRPDVLLSAAPFVRSWPSALGYTVPADLAFVDLRLEAGSGDAGVRHNCERVGALAVETVVGQLQRSEFGLPSAPLSTLVEGVWCDGPTLPARAARGVAA